MEIQEIEVIILENGQVQVSVRGVKGNSCLDLTREIETLLGAKVEERSMTSEANEDRDLPLDHLLDIHR
ncbi:MAG TPA: DUF2997 domain-containing protein [Anaerolineaceae bacterium]